MIDKLIRLLIVIVIICALSPDADGTEERDLPENALRSIKIRRCAKNPLITTASSPSIGKNINGPSVIRVPEWIDSPLGKYYMYFAHHHGKYIRLAYADSLEGPWRIYKRGTLKLSEAKAFRGHMASPDVHVDEEKKEIRMYFHGPARDRRGQWTGVALSQDGLTFDPSDAILGKFYFRVFKWKGYYYAIAKNWNSGWGELYRSKDGLTGFESRGNFIRMMRHCAVLIRDDRLVVFYSRKGDAPERIVAATVALEEDWEDWQESRPIDVIRPEKEYEGINYENKPSKYGSAIKVRQLRDPCIYEKNGRTYLFYTVAGEMGIAMAEIELDVGENQDPG